MCRSLRLERATQEYVFSRTIDRVRNGATPLLFAQSDSDRYVGWDARSVVASGKYTRWKVLRTDVAASAPADGAAIALTHRKEEGSV